MKFKFPFLILIAIFFATTAFAQAPAVSNDTFTRGEHLTYHINFYSLITGSVKAGDFELLVDPEKTKINNSSTFHCIARGKTTWAFDFFYKVNDRFECYMDEATLIPLLALRRIQETDFIRNEDLIFDHNSHKVTYKNNLKGSSKIISALPRTLDVLTAVYYLRSLKIPAAGQSSDIKISYIFADSLHTSLVKFLGTETLVTSAGEINCIKVRPQVLIGNVFKSNYPLTVWISNDNNRIPVLAETEIVLGKVRVELVSWAGLKSTFSALKQVKKT